MKEPATGRIQAAAANLGLAVASSVLLLGGMEVGLRLLDAARTGAPVANVRPERDLYVPHPYLPVVLRPSTNYRDGDTAGHINALGLRGPERTLRKPTGVFRVVCVGGSTTFGAGIVGDEKTWPARLESRLAAARPAAKIEVLNAGVPGYTTAENLIYLGLRLVDMQPDLVVLYEGYNDFKPNRHPGYLADYSHWRDRSAPPERPWGEGSRVVTRLRTALAGFAAGRDASVRDPRTGASLPRHDSVSEEGVATFRRNLFTMIATARAGGARVALATYPHPCTVENLSAHPKQFSYLPGFVPGLTFDGVRQAFDRYNEEVRRVAIDQGALLVDAAREVPPEAGLFVDHVHFNAEGAERFAEVMARALDPLVPADLDGAAR